ncbi:biotin--[acetyl-CoA-carboxylase] ligase [Bifidobacterium pullorum subsp. saeculare]|uniref:biotin--[acetyl-CoA-carboxylase] ligase n=1 Tax=Bifidobacterium pullorum TaxID=78448 RepID=UPI00195CA54C|nr:biotin--[acetyl-CoA-carboxylase] ligase [Bifidobacterium pullorum]MBM6695631.1 biotin--[acetyl-CoA-carboxylase] ligase [Bifidobacterium pullorum subsp. saeculare]
MNVNESEAMRRLPRTCRAADWVLWFDEVDSTNTVARRLLSEAWQPVDAAGPDVAGTATVTACAAAAGVFGDGIADAVAEPPIAVIVADSQTAGHGRLGRQWVSRPGESSMVSFATVLPQSLVTDSRVNGWLQMIAGLAAIDAMTAVLAETGADRCCASHGPKDDCALMLKWPNDVFLHGRKLGGILLESVMLPAADIPVAGLVIGIGLNLNLPADHLPTDQATSLQLHRAPLPDPLELRDRIAAGTVTVLRSRMRAFAVDPTDYAVALRDETEALCWTLGRRVEARMTDGSVTRGIATALNPDASLTVCADDGVDHVVRTGDVGVL